MIEQLEWLKTIKHNIKSLKKEEEKALAELDRMLAAGEMDDARDCGEDRWEITGMTLTRVKKMGGWVHSPEAKLKIDEIQTQDIESGAAKRKPPSEFWTTKLTS